MNQRARIITLAFGLLCVIPAHGETFSDSPSHLPTDAQNPVAVSAFSVSSDTPAEAPLPLSDVLSASTATHDVQAVSELPTETADPLSSPYAAAPDNNAPAASERPLGEVFIDNSKLASQAVEFYGQGSRPVSNGGTDRHSVYQDKDAVDPTEFGGGVKFNATDNFSISVEAGGELESDDSVDVDSGAVKFQLSY
ncbi:hypothetical protein ACFFLZ_12510 [Photobacterium aphoticum]|uniref:Uncharacterized protein n=1 Tax=Photobacterium aphoticum TaxID=754436 RepID=A0A0J1GRC7_9GAMM|nr:hypothetical protein [Photobacterium aphoticum]KLV02270.1 hypothetical protein ABT58_03700 [Photobacterium aphoticum]PSU57749.1 hypothetical protein C9I90_08820 [Photobacterium aphoticum]GHA55098.1 hypothetical protein GCM10007086_31430 [Photobacterium aphoticum]